MFRYFGPVMFLALGFYLYQNVGTDMSQYMALPFIDKVPGVGSSPADQQRATAYAFLGFGTVSFIRRVIHQSNTMDSGLN